MVLETSPHELQADRAHRLYGLVETRFEGLRSLHQRMDEDYKLWRLDPFKPDPIEGIAQADAYTTNRPRVVADVITSTISLTELHIRVPEDIELESARRESNDAYESLAIGLLRLADRRLKKMGEPIVLDTLAWTTVVRGWKTAARALLRKDGQGRTFADILPLDPRNLFLEKGDDEFALCAYRMYRTRREIRASYPKFKFADEAMSHDPDSDATDIETVYDLYRRVENPDHEPTSPDPFLRRESVYLNGVLINEQWARTERDLYCLSFPIVASAVDQVPSIATWSEGQSPGKEASFDASIKDIGESIFAHNRRIWEMQNRGLTYAMHLLGRQTSPPRKVMSLDGTATLGEGSMEKGAEIPLSTANQEDVELFQEADMARAAQLALSAIAQDETIGSLPPHTLGFIDQPLSSVALRQVGTTMRQKIEPRMRAVENCIKGCLDVMLEQFETGAFGEVEVSGRLADRRAFSRRIQPMQVQGHGDLEVKLAFEPADDDMLRINRAIQLAAPQPAFGGQSLGSLRYIREHVLNMQSSDAVEAQNVETQARFSLPVAKAYEVFKAAQKTGDEKLISVAYDALRLALMQHTVEMNVMMAQLNQLMQGGVPGQPPSPNGTGTPPSPNGQVRNPGQGGLPAVASTGIGNEPAEDAGYNTIAERRPQSDMAARLRAIGLEPPG